MRIAATVLTVILALGAACAPAATIYPDRWVYVSRNLSNDAQVDEMRTIIETAAAHGLNGMLWAGGLDSMDRRPPEFFQRLERVKAICAANKIEIIPIIFSAGYGGGVLGHDANLAAGLPAKDLKFAVHNGLATLAAEAQPQLANPGFEDSRNGVFTGFVFHDKPGQISFVDQEVYHSGKASLRFQNYAPGDPQTQHARVMAEVKVQPYAPYRVKVWVKTQDFGPRDTLRMQIYVGSRNIGSANLASDPTSDWREVGMTFNAREADTVRIYIGAWGAATGKFWVDDLSVEAQGLRCVLRRPGTPVKVTSDDGKTVYEEGRDFAPIADPRLGDFRGNHDDPPIRLLPGSRLQEGDRLRVSFYHGVTVNDGQVSVCMSEPALYEYWAQQAKLIQQHLAPTKWFFSMDEIRAGGACEACKSRNMTMGQILGDCITREVQMVREVSPGAKCYVWSDMLDPNHNAHGDYYLVEGDFTGSWDYIPKDIVIACWYFQKRTESLRFFSERGFETLAGAYYDGDDLENCKGWLEALDKTPKARGIMYTSWRNKYALLGPFGDLVSKR
jgi:hypothetical protein